MKLKIKSGNEDWNGVWDKFEVEKEMRELSCPIHSDTDWIEWVLDHVFDGGEISKTYHDVIIDDDFLNVSFEIGYHDVDISKIY